MFLIPKNWLKHQHYKSRRPPWIKVYREILDDKKFHALPDSSKLLLVMLWLVSSDDKNGVIHNDRDSLAFCLRRDSKSIEDDLKPLISDGWIIACDTLAECLQHAIPETEKRHIRGEQKAHFDKKIENLKTQLTRGKP